MGFKDNFKSKDKLLFQLFLSILTLALVCSSSFATQFEDLGTETAEELLLFFEEEELVIATGMPKPVRTAPAIATVITAEDIERIGAVTLDDVLETVPGLHVSPSPITYFSSVWVIRGLHNIVNPQVLLLINGVPFKNAYSGDRNQTFRMLAHKISKVEVIRGPGSAVHGADAFAGVINVITKDGKDISGSTVGASAASFDTYGAWLEHGDVYDGWNIALTLEGWKTNGDNDRIIERDRLGSGFPSNTPTELGAWHDMVDLTLGIAKDEWTFNLYGSVQDDFAGVGAIQAITEADIDTENLLLDITYHNDDLNKDLDLSVRLHYLYMYNNTYIHILPEHIRNQKGNPIVTQNEGGLEATAVYTGIENHMVRLSAGGSNVDVDTDQYKNWGSGVAVQFGPMINIADTEHVFMDNQSRSLWYLSLQDEWGFTDSWELTVGVRYDNYSDFGGTTNPRAAIVWEARPDLTAKLLYGRAFRAPSFAELYVKNNVSATGNPDIDPEHMESLELAFDYRPLRSLRTSLNLFSYRADDLIEFVPPSPQTAQNHDEQKGHGFEMEVEWKANNYVMVMSNFAYQRSESKELDAPVPNTPAMQFYLNPHWIFMPDWSLDGQLHWVGKRHRHPDDPREDIDDYSIVNLTLRRKNIVNHMDIAIGTRNIFDEDVREPSPYDSTAPLGAFIPDDYPMDGQSFWAEMRYNF